MIETTERLRVLLADDHELFRKGVQAVLAKRPDVELVGEAADGLEAIALARETVPDVILMDVGMPRCDGIEAVKVITRELPHVRIIMLTVSENERDLFEAIKSGAAGYLLKDLRVAQVFDMLDCLRRGETPISPKLAGKILKAFREHQEDPCHDPNARVPLSPREIEVLTHLVEGKSNKEIGEALCLTENTVKIYLRNILDKLHLENRLQAAVYAVRSGLAGSRE